MEFTRKRFQSEQQGFDPHRSRPSLKVLLRSRNSTRHGPMRTGGPDSGYGHDPYAFRNGIYPRGAEGAGPALKRDDDAPGKKPG